jgi:hypothetical protein
MEARAASRIRILGSHLQEDTSYQPKGVDARDPSVLHVLPTGANSIVFELQRLLDHDNHEDRQRIKDLMRDPIFQPRYERQIIGTFSAEKFWAQRLG